MMKFTLKFLLIFNLFCSVLLCNELSNTSNKIISLNSQLSIIKEQKSTTKDGDIAILEDEKNELLNRLPALITSSNDFNQTHLRSYIKALSAELNKIRRVMRERELSDEEREHYSALLLEIASAVAQNL